MKERNDFQVARLHLEYFPTLQLQCIYVALRLMNEDATLKLPEGVLEEATTLQFAADSILIERYRRMKDEH